MIGATMTTVGMPAADSASSAPSRFARRRGARLHGARELRIERRHRHRDLDEIALGHRLQDVEIAQHQRRFGDDADRMVELARALRESAAMMR